jgi:transposase
MFPSPTTLLPDPQHLRLRELIQEPDAIRAVVTTYRPEATCPQCGQRSARVHSWYVRKIADLPWHGVPLRLDLHLRRFFCDQPTCGRHIFAERLPGVVEPYARRTVHFTDALTLLGIALGGEAGARVAQQLAKTTSPATLLRLVRRETREPLPPFRVLSVDDFGATRSRMRSCEDSGPRGAHLKCCPQCLTGLNPVRPGQCSRTRTSGPGPVRGEGDC